MGLEDRHCALGRKHIDQPGGDPAMKCADHVRALNHRVAIRAIAKPAASGPLFVDLTSGWKPSAESAAWKLSADCFDIRRDKLMPDLTSAPL